VVSQRIIEVATTQPASIVAATQSASIVNAIAQRQTGAYALLDSLHRHGVQHIFGYPGGAILPIYDEIYRFEAAGKIEHILVRHEQGAAHAADGYARATGQVGVCFATSGPGATNLVTGIATAQMDSIPMVVVTGQVPSMMIGTDAFQETDIYGITLPIVKHSYVVRDPAEMSRIVAEAFYIAASGRPGVVLIDIPKDIGAKMCDYTPVAPGSVKLPGYKPTVRGNFRQIDQAVQLIAKSRQPLLYVGGGSISASAHEEIKQLAELFQIPVTTTLMGKGAFNEIHPLSVGMLGMHGTAYANWAVTDCDLLIAVGARFDDRVAGKLEEFAATAKVIHIDIDPAEIGKNRTPDVPIVGDIKQVLIQLLQRVRELRLGGNLDQTRPWLDTIEGWRADNPLVAPSYDGLLAPQEVVVECRRQAPDAYYTTDVGQHQMWAAQFLNNLPRHWISSAGLGTMGFGVPAAMGVQKALPNAQVICISGDASFQMNLQELGTLKHYGLNVKIVIINNGWQGMVRQWQEAFYEENYSSSEMAPSQPDFMLLAQAYGIKGMSINNREDLPDAIAAMLAHDGPVLLNAQVKRNENCYPMVPTGKSNAEMVGLAKPKRSISGALAIHCGSCGAIHSVQHKFCPDCGSHQ
jgi:acetolactate synthase I/II/III large subunit